MIEKERNHCINSRGTVGSFGI